MDSIAKIDIERTGISSKLMLDDPSYAVTMLMNELVTAINNLSISIDTLRDTIEVKK